MGPSPLPPKRGQSPLPQFSAHFYCGQTAACMKIPLGMELGLVPGDIVLDGDHAPLHKRGRSPPPFSAHDYCGQTAGWMKLVLSMEIGLSPGDFALDGDSAPLPQTGAEPAPQFSAHFYVPNGWMHQDATWYGCRPQPRGLCVRSGPTPFPKRRRSPGAEPPIFGPCLLWPNGWMDQNGT